MKEVQINTGKKQILVIDDTDFDGCVETYVGINHKDFIPNRLGQARSLTSEQWQQILPESDLPLLDGPELLQQYGVILSHNVKHPAEIYSVRDDSNIFQRASMRKWKEANASLWQSAIIFVKYE